MSGQYCESRNKAFTNGGTTIARYTRVKLSSGALAVAGLNDKDLGVTSRRVEANQSGDVALRVDGTTPMIASQAISAGANVYTAANGKIGPSTTGAFLIGVALEAATADGDVIEVLRNSHGMNAGI